MKKTIKLTVAVLFVSFVMAILFAASPILTDFNVQPNPMDDYGNVTCTFSEKLPITISLTDRTNNLVKTIYEGMSVKGDMSVPFDRIDNKGRYLEAGRYWVVISYQAKYTSTKKLLILK